MAMVQPDILPAMAEAIHRQLLSARGGRLARPALQEHVIPKGVARIGEKTFNDTLRELIGIGALDETDEQVSLPDLEGAREHGGMRTLVRERAMQSELEADLWEKDDQGSLVLLGARDLVRGLAWFLGLDSVEGPFDFEKTDPALSDLQEQHTGDRPIHNPERWRSFVRWARYLGFSSDMSLFGGTGTSLSVVLPDPTRALVTVLPTCAPTGEWVPLRALLSEIAARLPVLDGGVYRRALIQQGLPEAPGDCSPSLTLALLRLQGLGYVELDPGAGDAPKLVLANNRGAFHALKWTGAVRG